MLAQIARRAEADGWDGDSDARREVRAQLDAARSLERAAAVRDDLETLDVELRAIEARAAAREVERLLVDELGPEVLDVREPR